MAIISENTLSKLATTAAPAILRRARWSYLGYGLVAYGALRLAKRFGLFGEYPAKAVDFIDAQVKSKVGLGKKAASAVDQKSKFIAQTAPSV